MKLTISKLVALLERAKELPELGKRVQEGKVLSISRDFYAEEQAEKSQKEINKILADIDVVLKEFNKTKNQGEGI